LLLLLPLPLLAVAVALALAVAVALLVFCRHSERSEESPHFVFALLLPSEGERLTLPNSFIPLRFPPKQNFFPQFSTQKSHVKP
jgi:hypothetical protein